VCYQGIPAFLRVASEWRGKWIGWFNAAFAFNSVFSGLCGMFVCCTCAPAEKLFLDPAGMQLLGLCPVVYKSFRRFVPYNNSISSLESVEEGPLP